MVGDGSALSACASEVNGGPQVRGRNHIEKCRALLNGITNLLDGQFQPPALSERDREIAEELQEDLEDALNGDYQGREDEAYGAGERR